MVIVDNTSGDNKNKFVIGFLGHMVEVGLFKEVWILHHMVGHSHIDVDALIGVLAKKIRNKQIEDLPEFMLQCQNSVLHSKWHRITPKISPYLYGGQLIINATCYLMFYFGV